MIVRTNQLLHAVLLPSFDHPDGVATYLDFMKNPNESIASKLVHWNGERRCWETDTTPAAPRTART